MPPTLQPSSTTPKGPIVFTARGFVVDTRLKVFTTEFHVHSGILKLHSAFFFEFSDSPEKSVPDEVPVDADKSWGLEAVKAGEKFDSGHVDLLSDEEVEEYTTIFHKLLCAFYGVSYEFNHAAGLVALTQLADYYCALPRLSASSIGSLRRTQPAALYCMLPRVLKCAYKLRYRELFSDCVGLIAGDWGTNDWTDKMNYIIHLNKIPDPKLSKIIGVVRGQICEMVVEAQDAILRFAADEERFEVEISKPKEENFIFSLPRYYRNVARLTIAGCTALEKSRSLNTLLTNKMLLLRGSQLAGDGHHLQRLLCGHVLDENLPWDRN